MYKDGVMVVCVIFFKDKFENFGVKFFVEVVFKINEVVGDGIIIVIVFVCVIFVEMVKNVVVGCNFMDFCCGIQVVVDNVVEYFQKYSCDIIIFEEIVQVVIILVNGDEYIGKLIVNVMEKVGKEGVIIVKEGKIFFDEFEVIEGMCFDCGFVFFYFIIDVKVQKVEFEKFLIFFFE